ncbi:hypothetical protein NXC24_CH00940 [Rhizobium sp. NXC24]|nr:hypothetical protein NXC24_CH00940 [Rhizobium sp. NXC24]
MNDICSPPASFSPHSALYKRNVITLWKPPMPFNNNPFAASLIGRSALMRLAFVAIGIAILWATIGWAVALA